MKTELKNNTLCSPLKLIYLPNGIVAVDEEEVKLNDWVLSNGHRPIQLTNETEVKSANQHKLPKIIATSPSLNLHVLIIPEREDVKLKVLATDYACNKRFEGGIQKDEGSFIAGFRAHAASYPYSLKDMKGLARFILQTSNRVIKKNKNLIPISSEQEGEQLVKDMTEQFLSSLRPQIIWCQIKDEIIDDDNTQHGIKIEYKFKTNGKELVVIE